MEKIGIKGQWYLVLSLEDQKNFILPQDLLNFEVSSKLGLFLPEFILIFNTLDDEIVSSLTEGTKLKLTMGIDSNNSFSSDFVILKTISNDLGSNQTQIQCSGLLNNLKFFDNKINISDKISGIEEVLNQIKSFFPEVDTNIQKSNDSQNWINPNISTRQHIANTILHSWLETSWLSCGIDMDNTFILRDMNKKIKEKGSDKYDWRFTKNPTEERDIYFSNNPKVTSDSGFMNALSGYDRTQLINNFEQGTQDSIKTVSSPVLALADTLMRANEVESRICEFVIKNDNLHSRYYDAFLKNITQMVLFSTINIELVFENQYIPIKLLDIVMYSAISKKNNNNFNEAKSGLYFVTKIVRIQRNNGFGTKVIISRESFNSPTGKLK